MLNTKYLHILIPSSGLGKRSSLDYPKTLFQIKGEPILSSIIRKIELVLQGTQYTPLFFISWRSHRQNYEHVIENNERCILVEQPVPTGSGNAVLGLLNALNDLPLKKKIEEDFFLIWGDCVGFRVEIIQKLILEYDLKKCSLMIPGFFDEVPYTSFKVDSKFEVHQASEFNKNIPVTPAYTDIGVFLGKRAKMQTTLIMEQKEAIVAKRESSFINAVNLLSRNERVYLIDCASKTDKIGLNKITDLKGYL